ncbi:MAG: hypothetical protein LLG14_27425 [Nocardiaceae bacterium]|nr:hypothetical protein [Nocardiaceae bacterium]
MPIYSYRCDCGDERTEIRRIKDRDKRIFCTACGNPMRREQTVPQVIVKNPAVPRRAK